MNKRAKKQKAIIFVIVLILALIFVYPLFLIVMNSVKPLAQILTKPLSWPDVFQTENYVKAFKEVNVLHVMKNTAVLTIGSVAGYYFTCGDDCILDIQISDEVFKSL